jgi:hypothetical protein
MHWPPRSPDITPLYFFLWGYVKDIIYGNKVWDLRDLRARIVEAVGTMLQRTWADLDYRLDTLRVTNGARIEAYWF